MNDKKISTGGGLQLRNVPHNKWDNDAAWSPPHTSGYYAD